MTSRKGIMRALVGSIVAVALAVSPFARAAEVAGIKLEERVKLGGSDLVLSGAGVRTRFVVNVYVAGLYLTEKKTQAADVIAAPGPKRVQITLLRDLSAQVFSDALNEGLRNNTPEAELAKLKPQTDDLTATMLALKEAKKGDVILLDYVPEAGTQVVMNGKPQGKPLPGADFNRALLRIWVGERAADASLKRALLGQ
jgi:hypothetical protein